jgi:tryptophan halogenase
MSDYRKLDNIVIVGGGAAGWLAALYTRIALPKADITVIESSDIGILGAGEGTVPDFIEMTDFLGIPFSRLVKDADATIKNSIKFTNWTGDGSHFHHSFNTDANLGLD